MFSIFSFHRDRCSKHLNIFRLFQIHIAYFHILATKHEELNYSKVFISFNIIPGNYFVKMMHWFPALFKKDADSVKGNQI